MTDLIIKLFHQGKAYAAFCSPSECPDLYPTPFSGVTDLANSLINRLPYFLGGLAFVAILYSGALYILALGDPAKTETAKKNFTWTIIGIITISSIYMVISLIVYLTNNKLPG